MATADRRSVLRALGGTALAAAFPETIARALATPASGTTGTIQDVQHIVVLMQENRSFDHYFGMLRGVRGFSDPRAVTLSTGNSVFYQPNSSNYVLPFRPNSNLNGYQFLGDLAHSWSDAHAAWNNGSNDGWVAAKGVETMAYLNRTDLPFSYALADAFTICDNYHCSIMSSTDPNRYYMWTGWVGQNGTATDTIANPFQGSTPGTVTLNNSGSYSGNGTPPYGPVVNNDESGYNWLTYPERLQAAGVTWKVYQDTGIGLTSGGAWGWTSNAYIGNYGDNSLLYFTQYQNAAAGSPLAVNAKSGTAAYNQLGAGKYYSTPATAGFFTQLQADVTAGTLPQVSWIVAPQAYCEHPSFPANWGAWYIANVIATLASNPAVWSKTVLIINYDENDGFFDHLVAPTAPASAAYGLSTVSTVNEIYPGTTSSSYKTYPYGLGARVPLLIVSPWSKGGYVCSQTFDHTSVIQFIEKRFGVIESHITPWRRAVSGDLTAAFDFSLSDPTSSHLPSTTNYVSGVVSGVLEAIPATYISGNKTFTTLSTPVPATQTMPVQETGMRLARSLPYQFQADPVLNTTAKTIAINFSSTGTAGGFFHVRSGHLVTHTNAGGGAGPWGYTIDPATRTLSDTWTPTTTAYDLSVYSANGFFRRYAGTLTASAANLAVQTVYNLSTGNLTLTVTNNGPATTTVSVFNNYTGQTVQKSLAPAGIYQLPVDLSGSYSWYDLTVTASTDTTFIRHYAGHIETGEDSVSDPLISPAA